MEEEKQNNSGEQTEAAASEVVENAQTNTAEKQSGQSLQEESLQEEGKDQNIPLSALQKERAQRQQLQEELRMVKEHMSLLESNKSQPKEEKKDHFDGMDDDDVLTVKEAKKFLNSFNKQYQMSIDELKMTQKHPDYQEVITNYLPEVIKQNPSLRKSLEQTQDYDLAYYLAKNSEKYKHEKKQKKKNADAQRLVENSQKTGSLSSVGSTSPVSQAKRYKDMSDDEFKELVNRNMGYM